MRRLQLLDSIVKGRTYLVKVAQFSLRDKRTESFTRNNIK
jgi:hypothetical protein